ncbi:MAG: DUF5677 domain-containing protein [Actinomycetota bacterium]
MHAGFLSTAQVVDPDLYDPARFEVLTGITLRGLRAVHKAAADPSGWSGEHGFPLLRQVVEALIVLRWLVQKEDPAMYERFKDFGRGRLKLWMLHVRSYIDAADDVPDEMRELDDFLSSEVNQDIWEEFQDIDLGGTFTGIDARKMAQAVGMEREYQLLFAPASSTTHGEWSALDRYVLRRCLNPLHAWHRVPRADCHRHRSRANGDGPQPRPRISGRIPERCHKARSNCDGLIRRGFGPLQLAMERARYRLFQVAQLPQLTRAQLRALREPGRVWEGSEPMIGEVKYLEWSPAGGLRHATIVDHR